MLRKSTTICIQRVSKFDDITVGSVAVAMRKLEVARSVWPLRHSPYKIKAINLAYDILECYMDNIKLLHVYMDNDVSYISMATGIPNLIIMGRALRISDICLSIRIVILSLSKVLGHEDMGELYGKSEGSVLRYIDEVTTISSDFKEVVAESADTVDIIERFAIIKEAHL